MIDRLERRELILIFKTDIQKDICENKKKVQYLSKLKLRNEKSELDILNQIEKEHNSALNLSDYKLELVNELKYLLEYHVKKLGEIIENFEKSIQINPSFNGNGLAASYTNDLKPDRLLNNEDSLSMSSPSKKLNLNL